MDDLIEIFDLRAIANEVYCYLTVYMFPPEPPPPQVKFTRDLERLLVDIIRSTIDVNSHPYIQNRVSDVNGESLNRFCSKYKLNKHYFELILDDLYSVAYVLDKVAESCLRNNFNVWVIESRNDVYLFRCLGDFRLMYFEQNYVANHKKFIITSVRDNIDSADEINQAILNNGYF